MKEALKKGFIVAVGLIFQLLISLLINIFLIEKVWIINFLYILLSLLLILGLIRNSKNYSYTLPWIVILLITPLGGTLMYVIIGQNRKNSKVLKDIIKSEKNSKKYLIQDEKLGYEIQGNNILKYISEYAGYPVSNRNIVDYYSLGDDVFPIMLEEIEKAEKFIFFEYFIVKQGKMWSSILEILERKAKMGVEVRVMYDDAGCISTLEDGYNNFLESKGIKCVVFNKLHPLSSVVMNNRDHRKILIIDGKTAFSGGINIADEYINIDSPYGHWKDNAIKIEGDSVYNFTVMFLTMWNAFKNEDDNFEIYKHNFDKKINKDGYIVPYGETPLDEEETGKDIYLNIINQSTRYVSIFTPYLIIDTDMINSLILAAKRGVEVNIVIPGIPDKKIVYTLSESYLELLVNNGVNIYKYTPGFIHSKVFLSDDHIATVGTINLDYRSLYLHFECGVYLENCSCIKDIKRDVDETIKKSTKVTKEKATPNLIKAMWQAILRLFAPLM